MSLSATDLIAHAREFLHVREVAPNSSTEIDEWLARRHCKPGDSYCAAYVCAMVEDLDPHTTLVPSASALSLWEKNPELQIPIEQVQPGDVVIECHDAVKHLGHASLATDTIRVADVLSGLTTIAGNTSPDGKSRNGTGVFEHGHDLPDPRIVGALRVCN